MKVSFMLALVLDVGQIPASILIVLVVCCFAIVTLVLVNELACARLIRILKVVFGSSDNAPRLKRR